jgi:hypothetical protein
MGPKSIFTYGRERKVLLNPFERSFSSVLVIRRRHKRFPKSDLFPTLGQPCE